MGMTIFILFLVANEEDRKMKENSRTARRRGERTTRRKKYIQGRKCF